MLEWTGERYLPWIKDAAIAYEHLHRYVFATRLAKGKRVLDLASGEGYGTNMLAMNARSVIGVEIDSSAVQHARQKYKLDNLEFVAGSVTSIPIKEEHGFDLVVCFEAIEHIEDQQKLVAEAKRMLKPDGILLVSTPNKHVYQHESPEDNPFHVHELEFSEFQSLLRQFFRNVGFLGQRIHANSSIWPIGNSTEPDVEESVIARTGAEFEFVGNEQRVPLYYIAVASDAAVPANAGSILTDSSDQLLKDKDREIRELLDGKSSNEKSIAWQKSQLADRIETIASHEKAIEWFEDQVRALEDGVHALQEGHVWKDTVIKNASETIASHEQGIAWLKSVVERLEKDKSDLIARLQAARHQLELIHASRGWQWILRLRRLKARLTQR